MYASVVIGDEEVLAIDKPIIVVCVDGGHVYTEAAAVPTFLDAEDLKLFGISFP
jgi:hypothetical protein